MRHAAGPRAITAPLQLLLCAVQASLYVAAETVVLTVEAPETWSGTPPKIIQQHRNLQTNDARTSIPALQSL